MSSGTSSSNQDRLDSGIAEKAAEGADELREAQALYEAGRPLEALSRCLAHLRAHGLSADALELAGRAAAANSQLDAAASLLQKAFALDPTRRSILELLLEVMTGLGDEPSAERIRQLLAEFASGGSASAPGETVVPPALRETFGLRSRLRVVDIGSNSTDGASPYAGLLETGAVSMIGFEPQRDVLAKLNAAKGPHESYYPQAPGDGEEATLHLCRAPAMTSTCKPNQSLLGHFQGLPDWAEVVGTERVSTVRLDDLDQLGAVDWLKIDMRGAELRVFEHAAQRLASTLVIQVRVNFVPIYQGQAFFSDIDSWMRRQGFLLHTLVGQQRHMFAPLQVNGKAHQGLNQLTSAEAVYVPCPERLNQLSSDQLSKLAVILNMAYGSHDLALRALMIRDLRTGEDFAARFLMSLGVPRADAHAELGGAKKRLQEILDSTVVESRADAGTPIARAVGSETVASWPRKLLVLEPARGKGNLGVLNQHILAIREAALERGLQVEVIGNDERTLIEELAAAARRHDTAVYAGHFFFDARISGHHTVDANIFDTLGMPVIARIDDHPYSLFMWERVEHCARGATFASQYASLLQELEVLKGGATPHCRVLPSPPPLVTPRLPLRRWHERDIDLLIPFGLHKVVINGAALSADARAVLERESQSPERDASLLRQLSECLEQDPNKNLLQAFLDLYRDRTGVRYRFASPWSKEDRRWLALLSSLDQKLRLQRRETMLDQLANLPVEWKVVVTAPREVAAHFPALAGRKNITWTGVVPTEQLDLLYARSKRVLNCNPTYADGIHERLRNAMAWGCLVVSDSNSALADKLVDVRGIRLVERANGGVMEALTHDPGLQAEEAAAAASEIARVCCAETYFDSLFRLIAEAGRPHARTPVC